jgi:putative CocE/NonD family hydrolase
MPDGVRLSTHVMLPAGVGPFPTVLTRVPYPMGPVMAQRCGMLNKFGYACVWQFVRGRGRSEGEWVPLENEPADGAATLDWLVAQPFVDGSIALMGESYLGAAQWAVADRLPPQVKTIIPSVIGAELYGSLYEGGLFRHEIATAWMSLMPGDQFRLLRGSAGYARALRHRPRREADVVATGAPLPWYREWVDNDRPTDPYWTREIAARAQSAPERVTVPVLMLGGWADAFTGAQLATWSRLATQAQSTLVIGPWDHLGRVAADLPQEGVDAVEGLGDGHQWPRVVDWLDHHLRGRPSAYPVGVVTWPVGGSGWVTRDAWPPPTTPRVWALATGSDPQRCTGGLVDPTTGSSDEIVQWTYDPADPTPAVGADGVLAGVLPGWKGVPPGFVDQGDLCEERADLIGFRSAALGAPLHVAGALEATLVVATDAADSAFGVRFVEELADGTRIVVREAYTSLSFRDGADVVAGYTPGEPVTVALRTTPVEYVFQPWSRVLVEVSSASFPRLEAHSNLDEDWAAASRTVAAQQRLWLAGSSVGVPVVAPGG